MRTTAATTNRPKTTAKREFEAATVITAEATGGAGGERVV